MKPGDKVICIDADNSWLEEGREYTVVKESGYTVAVDNGSHGVRSYKRTRFAAKGEDQMKLKIGDKVKIIDGSYAVRVDTYEEFTSIGRCRDTFEVLHLIDDKLSNTRGKEVHNIFIKNLTTGAIYLHSEAFVKKVPARVELPMDYPVMIFGDYGWTRRHFAGWDKDDNMLFWVCGGTSHSWETKAVAKQWYWED